ncbi:MAG TPA: NfeD family protein [Vicinamibacterales bacterium]
MSRSLVIALVLACVGWAAAGIPAQAQPRAIVAEYDGIIHPITAEFVDQVLDRADRSGATLTVVVLRTPGGLLDSTRTIVSRMLEAEAPVVVYIAPSGARAASAGFVILLAADVAAVAPGTHIGAAHPVSAGGGEQQGGETMAKKAASDVAAYARTLADARNRNAALAAEAVLESRAFTYREAAEARPPLVDLVADDLDELLKLLDGREVPRFDGTVVVLETDGIRVERVEMTRRQHFLSAIAHPQIAYFLLTLGMLGLTVELWNPGSILPGVVGGTCLLLAFFAFQILPLDTVGLLLILFGLGLLVLELKVPSFGALGIGGTVAIVIGSIMLTDDIPGVGVPYSILIPVALATAGIFLFLGRLALRAQRARPVTGAEGLIGRIGRTVSPIGPDRPGQIQVHGELWQATSDAPIAEGRRVRVAGISGLVLHVEEAEGLATEST